MTENRTSQAVEKWLLNMESARPRSIIPQHLADNIAIAEKYKRMEEALFSITLLSSCQHAGQIASEALSYDPLSE